MSFNIIYNLTSFGDDCNLTSYGVKKYSYWILDLVDFLRTVSKLEDQARRGAEQVESLKNSLLEETNVSAKQRIELERLKVELEKAKDLIEKLKSAENEKYFADAKFDLLSERDEGMVNFVSI